MPTPLFTLQEATSLEGRAFERVILEVLVRKSTLCDLHKTQLRGRLDVVEASAQLGVALPECVFDRITAIDYHAGDVRFKTVRFHDAFATLADIAGRQKALNSTESMYFIRMYHAFAAKLVKMEHEAGTISPTSMVGPVSQNLWFAIGGGRFTIEQYSAGRSMDNFVCLHTSRCVFLANKVEHNDFVSLCSCPDRYREEAAAAGGPEFEDVVVQAVVRGLAPEIWDVMSLQRRRGAIVNDQIIKLSMVDFLALYKSEAVKTAMATLEEQLVAPPAYPGHPGLQPGEVQEVGPEVSSRHVDIDWILASLQSMLV